MERKTFFMLLWAVLSSLAALSQDVMPSVSPTATYTDRDGEQQETTIIDDGEAPLEVTFRANPEHMDGYTPNYTWHFRRQGEQQDILVRYEEETTYRFTESGTFDVILQVMLDATTQLDSTVITVAISESRLEFPNAFSPNGDGINDVYKAKEGWRSIVSFHASIFNRWGQRLFEWTDPARGWDGTYKGHDVKQGVYYVLVKAKGADGRDYHIRKDVNLLRGYTEGTTTTE